MWPLTSLYLSRSPSAISVEPALRASNGLKTSHTA